MPVQRNPGRGAQGRPDRIAPELALAPSLYDECVDDIDDGPTRGWLLTRIELALGIAAAIITAAFVLVSLEPMFGESTWERLGVIAMDIAVITGLVVGLVWMIRIFRGQRDEPPGWRYRSR